MRFAKLWTGTHKFLDAMRHENLAIGIVPNCGLCPETLAKKRKCGQKLKCGLAVFGLLIAALLPFRAFAQITEPLLPTLPGGVPLSAPERPQAVRSEPESGYPGETVTSRARPEFNVIGLRFGEFYLFPRAELDENYNSNIFATPTAPSSDLITALNPSFDLISILPNYGVNLHGSASLQQYATHPAQNTQTGAVSADGSIGVTSGSSITWSTGISHPYIAYGLPNSPTDIAEPVTYWNYFATTAYQQTGRRFTYGISAGVSAAQYNAAPLVGGGVSPQSSQNSIVPSAAVNLGYEIAPDYTPYISFDASRYEYLRASSASFNSYSANFGLRIAPRHLIYGNVYAGYIVGQSSTGSSPFPDYGAELVWTVTTLTTLTFDGLRTFYTGTPTTTFTQLPSLAGNSYLASTVGVRADHELLRNLLLTLNGTFENDNFQGITRMDNVFGAATGFTYLINPHLFVAGYYSYYKRISTLAGASFNQSVVTLRLGTQF